jgi:hypothetical protein
MLACGAAVLSGCAGLANTSNAAATPQATVEITPSVIAFSGASLGQKLMQTARLTNTGNETVTITELASTAVEFATTGLSTPLAIKPGQSATFQVVYTASKSGSSSGTLTAMTSKGGSTHVKLKGANAAQLSFSTTTLNFGNVLVNGKASQAVTLKNSGQSDVQITQIGVSGGAFSVAGLIAPVTISAGQSVALEATFAPTTAGAASGAITIASNAQNSTSTVTLNGSAVAASYTMAFSPGSLSFGNVSAGSSATQSLQLANTGNSSVTVTQVAASGAGISVSGVAVPVTLAPSQSVALSVRFAPTTAGASSGSVTVTNSDGVNAAAAVTGTQVQAGLSLTPTTASFGSVVTGSKSSQTIQIKNSGTANLTVSQAMVSGAGFSANGMTLPMTLTPGQSGSLNVQYAPQTAGNASGLVSIMSNAPNSPATVALNGTATAATSTMALSPTSLNFGNVNAGSSATQSLQLANTGNSSVTVTQVAASGAGISVSGVAVPVTLAPTQSVALSVTFAPTAAGATSGSVTVTNSDGVNAVAAVTGTQVQAGLSLTPTSASFGSVVTGSKSSQTIQIKNSGTANLTVSQATVSGAGFGASGMTLPMTLTPGQSGSLNVQYAPQTAGNASGLVSIVSNAANSPATVPLSGTGTTATSTMALSPVSLNFGNVNAGSSTTQSLQLANTGNSSVTVTQVAASGAGISVSGAAVPVTLAPTQSVALSVTFAPTAAGATSGSVTVTNSDGVNAVAAVTGTQVQAGLSLTPTSASFGSVVTGNTNSQTVQIRNSGTANLTVSQATVTGAGFSLNGLALPMTLTPGQNGNFNVQYAPQAAGNVSGAVSIVSNAPNSPATVALSATGVAASYTISVNPSSLSFGSVTDGSSTAQGFTVTNTGNSNVAISGMTATGAGYSIVSGAGAVTLSPNQSTSVSVQFAPSVAGSTSGSATILSNATGSNSSVSLSGTGVAPPVSHSVALNWASSSSSVAGYNVYRSSVSGSSYARMNASPVGGVSYADSSVLSGQTYYYVATSVDASGSESVYSNEVSAIVP